MSSKTPIIIASIIALSGLGATYMYLEFEKQEQQLILEEKKLAQEQDKLEFEKRKQRKDHLQSLFDTYLNDFRVEIRDSVVSYKGKRRILSDMIKPKSFSSPEYAKENYEIFKNSIAPSLYKGAEDLFGIFAKYRSKIQEQTGSDDSDIIDTFNDQWRNATDKQMEEFIDFFAAEENVIRDYDALITFYYTHSKLYEVDEKLKIFIFDRDEDVLRHNALLGKVKKRSTPDISKKQRISAQ